eukprot:1864677-Pyramimonas_sp.AAC.1
MEVAAGREREHEAVCEGDGAQRGQLGGAAEDSARIFHGAAPAAGHQPDGAPRPPPLALVSG